MCPGKSFNSFYIKKAGSVGEGLKRIVTSFMLMNHSEIYFPGFRYPWVWLGQMALIIVLLTVSLSGVIEAIYPPVGEEKYEPFTLRCPRLGNRGVLHLLCGCKRLGRLSASLSLFHLSWLSSLSPWVKQFVIQNLNSPEPSWEPAENIRKFKA